MSRSGLSPGVRVGGGGARRTERDLRREVLNREARKAVQYAVPRMDETIARFVEFLTMTPKEQAVYASLPRKLDHFARNLFRDRFQSMQTFGSVRTGFATILNDTDIVLTLNDSHSSRSSLRDLLALQESLPEYHAASITQLNNGYPALFLKLSNLGVRVEIGSPHDEMAMSTSADLNPLVKPLVSIVAHAAHKNGLCIPTFIIAKLVLFHFQIYPPDGRTSLSLRDVRRFMHLLHKFDFDKEVIAIDSQALVVNRTDFSGHPVFMTHGDNINLALTVSPDAWCDFREFVHTCHKWLSYPHTRMLAIEWLCSASKAFLERRAHLAQISDDELMQNLASVSAVPVPPESKKRTADKVDHGGLKGTWRAAKRFKFGKSEAHGGSKNPPDLLGNEKGDRDGAAIRVSSASDVPSPSSCDDFVIVEASGAVGSDALSLPGTGEDAITTRAIVGSRPASGLARAWGNDLEDDDDSDYIFINYPKQGARREHEPVKTRSPPNSWHAEVRVSRKPASSRPRRFMRTIHDVTESILSRNAPKRQDDPSSAALPALDATESEDDKGSRKRKLGDCVMM